MSIAERRYLKRDDVLRRQPLAAELVGGVPLIKGSCDVILDHWLLPGNCSEARHRATKFIADVVIHVLDLTNVYVEESGIAACPLHRPETLFQVVSCD